MHKGTFKMHKGISCFQEKMCIICFILHEKKNLFNNLTPKVYFSDADAIT